MTRLFLKTNQKENPVSKEASNTGNLCKDKRKTGKEKAQTIKGCNDHKGQKKGNKCIDPISRKVNLLNQGNQAKQRNGLDQVQQNLYDNFDKKHAKDAPSTLNHVDNGAVCNLILDKIGWMGDTVARKIPSKKQDKQLKSILLTVKIGQKTRTRKKIPRLAKRRLTLNCLYSLSWRLNSRPIAASII